MKTNTILAALLMGVALFTFSCKQQTATQIAAQQGEWVEITNVTSFPDIQRLSAVYSTWEGFTGLAISDTASYLALANMIDTTDQIYKVRNANKYPEPLPTTPDFSQYSMVGLRTLTGPVNYQRKFFVNDSLQQYRLLVTLESNSMNESLHHSQNWLLVPRLKQGYTVVFDTTTAIPGR